MKNVLLAAIMLLVAVGPVRALPLFLESFEDPAQLPGQAAFSCCGGSVSPGWVGSGYGGYVGVYNPTGTGRFNSIPGGSQYAYINAPVFPGAHLSRDAGVAWVAGTTYVLQASIGADLVAANNDSWQLELWSGQPFAFGSALLALLNAGSLNAVEPTAGDWAVNTLSYTAVASGGEVWASLGVLAGSRPGYTVSNFDLVSVTAINASTADLPEPASGGLLAIAGALAWWTRGRQAVAGVAALGTASG